MSKDYAATAEKYARDVVSGEIDACKWVKGACQRHLSDLERFADGSEYLYNPEITDKNGVSYHPVHRVCAFVEQLPHIKGQWAGQKFSLEPWQAFILAVVFGWVTPEGLRRFNTAYLEVPRKNGKTFLMSAIGLYLLCADGEGGAEVYSAAVKKDQARICWDTARRQVLKTPELQAHFGVEAWKHSIFIEDSASLFQPLASDSDSLDGLNIHGGLIDELHAHKSREVFDVIETGTGARQQSLMFIITTAGSNQAGICYEQRTYATKLLGNVVQDESYFGIIYTLDDDEIDRVWDDEKLWAKANPNYGVSVLPFDIARLVKKAKQSPSSQNNVLTKRFNVWVQAGVNWMDMWRWNACHDDSLTIDQFAGQPCWMGADFASKKDIAAVCWLFERDGTLYPFLKYYLPDERIRNHENDLYSGWWKDGLLTITPGQIIDFDYIERDVMESASRFQVVSFGYDPHQATQFAGHMVEAGLPMVELRPGWANYSEPMKELEARALAKTIRHNDPILTWMVSNTIAHEGAFGAVQPRKERPENKIDGVIALTSAMNRYMQPGDESNIYDRRGLVVV